MNQELWFTFLIRVLTVWGCSPKATDKTTEGTTPTSTGVTEGAENRTSTSNVSGTLIPKIINGRYAKKHEVKYIARLSGKKKNEKGEYIWKVCAGSIIDKHWIITAAHCCEGAYEFKVVVAEYIKSLKNEEGEFSFNVPKTDIYNHENYDGDTENGNDICMLLARTPMPLNKKFAWPISLPWRQSRADSGRLEISGWGRTIADLWSSLSDKLKMADVKYVEPGQCETRLETNNMRLAPNVICAIGQLRSNNYTDDTCKGDSGGPLAMRAATGSDLWLVGITSYGFKCGIMLSPGVYTRVYSYLDWIQKTSKIPGGSTYAVTKPP